jgi:uncharacterized iron-regulated protein
MTNCHIEKFWAWSLGIILLWSFPATAQQITSPLHQGNYDRQTVLAELAQAKVVYLGETHDSPNDHQAQLEILRSLHSKNPKIAIALEMFQRPYQKVLDRYLAGELTEARLQEQSQYDQRWGFPWEYYAPVLRFAKENSLPLLALNTPTEVTRKVSRAGLESLTSAEKQLVPPLSAIDVSNSSYRQRLLQAYQGHKNIGSAADFERFFQAQVLWDETMAETIANFLRTNPGYQVVVLAGQGHIACGYGIPNRVARRVSTTLGQQQGKFTQYSVLLNPAEDLSVCANQPAADYFWYNR